MTDTGAKFPRVNAVLLAAGESRRMGNTNKLVLPVGGVTLLQRTAKTLLASSLQEIIVVLGYQSNSMRLLLSGLDVTIINNKDYRRGQMTSVYEGLKAITQSCDGVMICLTDQPLLTPNDINKLIDAFVRRSRGSILVPMYKGRRGNPIVLSYEHCDAIIAGDRNLGCKRLIERNPDMVEVIEMDNDHTVIDLDTPADYAAFRKYFDRDRINANIS